MKRKGFTLVELLVVIAIIALLMSILMPALARVRGLAQQVVCGSHLASMGKALMMYANDFHDQYVRAGGPSTSVTSGVWGATLKWDAKTEVLAYGASPSNKATIGACLYYLVKYGDVAPKTFICGGDIGAKEFKLADHLPNDFLTQDIMLAWDFGPSDAAMNILEHYSYAYQYPFTRVGAAGYFPVNSLSDAGIVIMADKSPYMVLTPDTAWQAYMYRGDGGTVETERWGNSPNHKRDGQNILFNDCHVSFEREPYCGFGSDNIYTYNDATKKIQEGGIPTSSRCFNTTSLFATTKMDSVLINEGKDQGPGVYP
jgi:prepilin-type N-terminal cleavage/methylation domain-containing protein